MYGSVLLCVIAFEMTTNLRIYHGNVLSKFTRSYRRAQTGEKVPKCEEQDLT